MKASGINEELKLLFFTRFEIQKTSISKIKLPGKLSSHIKFCLTTDDVHELVTGLARGSYRTENLGICRSLISVCDG